MPSPKPPGALRSFAVAFRLLLRSLKPMAATLLLVLLPCELLSSLTDRCLPPVFAVNLNFLAPNGDDVKPSLHQSNPPLEVRPISLVVSLLSKVATVHLSVMACSGGGTTVRDLFRSVRRTWPEPVATLLWAQLFQMLPTLVWVILARVLRQLANTDSVLPVALILLLSVGILAYLMLLGLVESLGLVASVYVVEEGGWCYGFGALGNAWAFTKGRKFQAFVLMLATVPLGLVISKGCGLKTVDVWEELKALAVCRSLLGACMCITGNLYAWLVYSAFYCNNREERLVGDWELGKHV